MTQKSASADYLLMETERLQQLINVLIEDGYSVIAPTPGENAIIYDEISSVEQLPLGIGDEQDGATYRLVRRDDNAFFGYNCAAYSWKKFLHKPKLKLYTISKNGKGLSVKEEKPDKKRLAFLGVRACEAKAIDLQDRIFMDGEFKDQAYSDVRKNCLIIAVNCTRAGGTCFCTSMGTGPAHKDGFDLALTEVIDKRQHFFVVESGSAKGKKICQKLGLAAASESQISLAQHMVDAAADHMGRKLDVNGLKEILQSNAENPAWNDVAERCLNCANCTMVCPTCFCTTVEDVTSLDGNHAERWRRWDSCFTMDFSYIHGGSIRYTSKSRYRQWISHKLAGWVDQFGETGCTGCGRCITWCPAAIDITEEARVIREKDIRNKA